MSKDVIDSYISTGSLPESATITRLLEKAHSLYADNKEGQVSSVYPALERVEPELFGSCLVTAAGGIYMTGDAETEFSIMSISKPFIFALVCQHLGAAVAREKLGVNSTGKAFNSLSALENNFGGKTNPMVNPGAIATTSFIPGSSKEERWGYIYSGLCRFAGKHLSLNEEIYASAMETNYRNRGIANALFSMGLLGSDPESAVELYTRQCSLNVSAKDLAVMGATLADGGVNPLTLEHIVSNDVCHYTLAVMVTAGLYETSGDWLYNIGLPGKSGIGGGIVAVSPGKGGLGTFAPRLDTAGNSVKGQLVARHLSRSIGMDLFVSKPYVSL